MALGQNAGILFKIKAEGGEQARREIEGVKGEVGGLSTALGSTVNPATLAAAAITAVAAASVTAAVAIFQLTKNAAEYGSAIYRAGQQTGLTVQTLSVLQFAANQSGVSFDGIKDAVAKFNVTLGEASTGNKKASDTLNTLGVTSRSTDEALRQAITTVATEADVTKQAAAAKKLFGDETAKILPVIKSFGGDLTGLQNKLEKLGLVLSAEDARAAEEFQRSLDLLSAQAAATGRAFASELMPLMVSAMQAISRAMAENKDVARVWGTTLADAARGVGIYFSELGNALNAALNGINRAFGTNLQATLSWSKAIYAILGPLFGLFASLGAANRPPGQSAEGVGGGPAVSVGRVSGGGGRRGGGGGGAAAQDTSVSDAQRRDGYLLADLKEGNKARLAELERQRALELITEQEFIREKFKLKLAEIAEEKRLLEQQLNLEKLTAKEREEIENKLRQLRSERHTEEVKFSRDATKQGLDDIKEFEKALEEFDDYLEELHQKQLKRAREEANARLRGVSDAQKDAKRQESDLNLSILGDSPLIIRNEFGNLENTITPLLPVLQLAGQAVQGLAQGFGNLLQQMILTGTAGPNAMKKLVASVLAGVSAQAATMAIMELAYGIAALTPWGAAIYGPAPFHFKSAALFGAVAVGTGLAGRAIAGDSFNQASGGGAGGGSASQPQQNNFTTQFEGFNKKLDSTLNRQTMVLAQLEETNNTLAARVKNFSAGEVLGWGAEENPEAVRDAYESVLSNSPRPTEALMRQTGGAR